MVLRPAPNNGERRDSKDANREMIKPLKVALKEEVEPGNVAWVFRPEAFCRKQNRRAKGLTSKEMSYIDAKLPKTEKKSILRTPKSVAIRMRPDPVFSASYGEF
jgi:hypothetical protein